MADNSKVGWPRTRTELATCSAGAVTVTVSPHCDHPGPPDSKQLAFHRVKPSVGWRHGRGDIPALSPSQQPSSSYGHPGLKGPRNEVTATP